MHRRDKFGRGVLHYAVEKWTGEAEKDRGRLATIQVLVKAGAPANVLDLNGQTAVFQLVRYGTLQARSTALSPIMSRFQRHPQAKRAPPDLFGSRVCSTHPYQPEPRRNGQQTASQLATRNRLFPRRQRSRSHCQVCTGAHFPISKPLFSRDRKGLTVADTCEGSSLRQIVLHLSQLKQRPG